MSLTARLSTFFLGALALVLLGFSTALFLAARTYLHRQADARLGAALDTLVAAAEIDARGVEWEPGERRLTLGVDPGVDQVRWMIRDGRGKLVDQSKNTKGGDVPPRWGLAPSPASQRLAPWRLDARRLLPDPTLGIHSEPHDVRHGVLVLSAGLSLQPVQSALGTLAFALFGLSSGTWLLAACLGRRLCRRALAPLSRMASAARAMTAADLAQRLPDPGTGDELEELGQAFNDLLARVHEAFERQRRFTGDASHQLRTPLTALLGQVEVALRRDRPGEEYRRVLGVVHRRAAGLRQIIESLLFLARAESEAELPELDVVDLAAWLPEHLRRWAGHPRGSDLRAEVAEGSALLVRVHQPLLAQALDNLIDNAWKYSPAGLPVEVRAGRAEGSVVLSVRDRGDGLAPEDHPHVFEPFFRAQEARRQGVAGVGLGLSVVQRIVTAFGGAIVVESEPGAGCRFEIRLPTSDSSLATPRDHASEQPAPALA